MQRHAVILVQKSRRPRRWAGVAMLAAVLIAILFLRHGDANRSGVTDFSSETAALPYDSFESVLLRAPTGAIDHNAQLTDFAASSSSSTNGDTPTK